MGHTLPTDYSYFTEQKYSSDKYIPYAYVTYIIYISTATQVTLCSYCDHNSNWPIPVEIPHLVV